jgi:hypothetical protein
VPADNVTNSSAAVISSSLVSKSAQISPYPLPDCKAEAADYAPQWEYAGRNSPMFDRTGRASPAFLNKVPLGAPNNAMTR